MSASAEPWAVLHRAILACHAGCNGATAVNAAHVGIANFTAALVAAATMELAGAKIGLATVACISVAVAVACNSTAGAF